MRAVGVSKSLTRPDLVLNALRLVGVEAFEVLGD